jgi:predicted amidophosphoribosyltransferase
MAFCSNCGGKIEEGVKFCSGCGKAVGIPNEPVIPVCSGCGKQIEDGVKFCSGCGKAVGGMPNEPVAQIIQQQSAVVQTQSIMADEKYCYSCGSVIKKAAGVCPKCGMDQIKRSTTAVDVYCTSCGKTIKKEVSACPFCGVKQESGKSKFGFTFLSFIIPFMGLIFFIVWRKNFPRQAKSCGIAGIIGFVFFTIMGMISGGM